MQRDHTVRFERARDAASSASTDRLLVAPPLWIDVAETLSDDIRRNKTLIAEMKELNALQIRRPDEEHRLIELRGLVAKAISRNEHDLKLIGTVGLNKNTSHSERVMRLNAMKKLGQDVFQQSKDLRQVQEERQAVLEETQQDDEELLRLCTSIQELNQISKDLNQLVLSQGEIVDRIDYNVERGVSAIRAGNKELQKADEYQSKSCSKRIILILLVIAIVLAIVIGIKHR